MNATMSKEVTSMSNIAEMLAAVKTSASYSHPVHLSMTPAKLVSVKVDRPNVWSNPDGDGVMVRYPESVSPWYTHAAERPSAVNAARLNHDSNPMTWGALVEWILTTGHRMVQPMRYEQLHRVDGVVTTKVCDYAKDSVPLFNIVKSAGQRDSKHIEAYYAVMLDCDNGKVSFDEACAMCVAKGWEFFAYTSFSHKASHHKYRLVILLSAPVVGQTMMRLIRQLSIPVDGDRSCKDPGRYFYPPSAPADSTDHRLFYNPGAPLSVAEVAALEAADNAALPKTAPKAGVVQKSHKKASGKYATLPQDQLLRTADGTEFDLYSKAQADFATPEFEGWKRVYPFCHEGSGTASAFCSWNDKRSCAQVTCPACEKTWFASKRASTDDIDWPVMDRYGKMQPAHRENVYYALELLGYACRYDTACSRPVITRNGVVLTSELGALKTRLLSELLNFGFGINTSKVHLDTWYTEVEFNSVREYLESEEWDGEDHLAQLDAAMNATSEGASDYLMKWLIGAVAVTMQGRANNSPPMVLTFLGEQGACKTTFGKELTRDIPHLFCESASLDTSHATNTGIKLGSAFVVELGEIGATMSKSDFNSLKACITAEHDSFRPLYSNSEVRRPRQCVLYATVNDTQFIRDDSRSRRWWVIETTGIDGAAMRAINMRQLWAQVKWLYDAEMPWWYEGAEQEVVKDRNQQYQVESPILETIKESFTDDPNGPGIGTEFILRAIYGASRPFTAAEKQSAGYACRSLGFQSKKTAAGVKYMIRHTSGPQQYNGTGRLPSFTPVTRAMGASKES